MEHVSFAFDQATDDIVLENGTIKMITGEEEVAQAIWLRLRTWRTEWYLNTLDGIPYFDYWQKGVHAAVLHADFLTELYKDERIASVVDLRVDLPNTKDRQALVKFVARLVNGAILQGERRI
jgi:hypothetical protein